MATYKDVQRFGSKVSDVECLLERYEERIFNPRTHEKVLSCVSVPLSKQQRRVACVPYHTQVNRQCSATFSTVEALRAYVHGEPIKPNMVIRGKPTAQFKTCWYSKGMKRK